MRDDLDRRIGAALVVLAERDRADDVARNVAARIRRPAADRRRPWLRAALAAASAIALVAVLVSGGFPDGLPNPASSPTGLASRTPSAPTESGGDDLTLVWSRTNVDGRVEGRDTAMLAVARGGPGLVAVGRETDFGTDVGDGHRQRAVVWTSLDGRDWTRVADGDGFESAAMTRVVARGAVLLASGYEINYPNGIRPRLWHSEDGLHWEVGAVPITSGATISAVAAGTAEFLLAVMDANGATVMLRSADGRRWEPTDVAAFAEARIGLLAHGEAGWLAIGERRLPAVGRAEPLMWRSTDGERWAPVPLDPSEFEDAVAITDLLDAGALLVAVGTVVDHRWPLDPVASRAAPPTEGMVWISTDGVRWERVPAAEARLGGIGDQRPSAVVETAGGYVVVGSDRGYAAAWTSPDAVRWRPTPLGVLPPGFLADAADVAETVVAVGAVAPTNETAGAWTARAGESVTHVARARSTQAGGEQPFELYTHCGVERAIIDFDESLWQPFSGPTTAAGSAPAGWGDPVDRGTITLTDRPDVARYRSSAGEVLLLARADRELEYVPCR